MTVTTPDWLTQRGGELRASRDGRSFAVYLGGEPQYLVVPTPAGGKFGCRVAQSVNGKRFDGPSTYPTFDEAARGGLDDLRKALGW